MMVKRFLLVFVLTGLGLGGVPFSRAQDQAAPYGASRQEADKLRNQGNYKEALEAYKQYILKPDVHEIKVTEDFHHAIQCMQNLNQQAETDALRESMVAAHPSNWRVKEAVALSYQGSQSWGYMVAGEFKRGHHRGGGKYVNAAERDRVRAFQLMTDAVPLVENESDRNAASQFFQRFARTLTHNRHGQASWRLQYLTDLSQLPDYAEGHNYYGYGSGKGAPVDAEGNPIYYRVPASYATAINDGERWRWLLRHMVEVHPAMASSEKSDLADFMWNQLGVQTMAHYAWFFQGRRSDEAFEKDESGTYALHTLEETETIARLATGIKRITIPEEFNYVRLYRELNNLDRLADIFTNRRQYPKAADFWRQSIKQDEAKWKKERLAQIVDNWGRFEVVNSQPAGSQATVEYLFRNGREARFTAKEIDVEKLLGDIKEYISSNPIRLDWQKVSIPQIGHRLINQDGQKYVGRTAARWQEKLQPQPDHFDRRITVKTPLDKPGAYLVTAQMEDGNESRIILWINDTVIVKKALSESEKPGGSAYYFIADAVSGKPVAKANVEFFGYWAESVNRKLTKRYQDIHTTQFAEYSDADGQVIPARHNLFPQDKRSMQYIVTARTKNGRFAFLGFSHIWHAQYHDQEYEQTRGYGITDRPVYRPGQTVKFKAWLRHAKYDQEDTSPHAGQQVWIKINNPKHEETFNHTATADAYGGVEGEYVLPKDAPLGVYSMNIRNHGNLTFRVEEYKKPEFEVKIDAPTDPVALGEKVEATITSKYYFGAPVASGNIKIKVTRTSYSQDWYPPMPWDWFYGPGYWWFAYDYDWYPGWGHWGCFRPWPWWWPRQQTPPEVVMETEMALPEDGIVKIPIDTAIALAMHPDTDHRYQVTAEVTDESRRTIVGQGQVLVARRPFKVYTWVNRGYYRPGDVVEASFAARTLDSKPVSGKGKLTLFRISYDQERKPLETPVRRWDLDTDAQGEARLQLKASRAGQYRLSYTVTDNKQHAIEGGYVFTVRGEGRDGQDFRFNHLELITEKTEYAPGEKVQLMINTDHLDSTVVLFVRPSNGIYLRPKILRIKGQTAVESIEISKKDMPNFFVEAFTVSNGKVYREVREIIVPPEKRVLNVEVLPSSEQYKPGEKATIKVRVTDWFGKPFKGSTVMTVYDRAVEYISGGPNVGDIKEYFWKWRRRHNPAEEHSLNRMTAPIRRDKEVQMGFLGVFGASVADEVDKLRGQKDDGYARNERRFKASTRSLSISGGMLGFSKASADMAMPMAACAPMLMEADAEGGERMDFDASGSGAAGGEAAVQPTVRTQFADTAFWTGSLETGEDGVAEVTFDMPENLTGWKIRTWAMGHGTKVGEGEAEVVTTKNLLLRLQAPRFFVEKDEVVLSANIHNYLDNDKQVTAVLELDGPTLESMTPKSTVITIPAGGEKRVDWRVKVLAEGEAVVRMKALTDEESDAMEMRFPVYVHGMLKTDSFSGSIRPDDTEASIELRVPEERRPEQSRLEIRYSPTLAGAMVDALPYLADYPYGCTEQTLSRFLPAVLTQKILKDMGLDLQAIKDKRTNLNAQEIGEDTERAKQWKRYDRNPVFDEAELDAMVRTGLMRLYAMQLSDGGWGWFSGWGERSSAHTTAYVVHGFQIARQAGLAIVPDSLSRGIGWLKRYQKEQLKRIKDPDDGKDHPDNLDAFVFMVLVDEDIVDGEMRDLLYEHRTKLAVYAKSMIGLAYDRLKMIEQRDMVLRNIDQYLVEDAENQSAWLELGSEGYWWYWYGSEYEAHAYYLKLLSRTDPKGQKAAGLVKYLLNNRKHGTYWKSTRDTAVCVEAMAEFLRASGEDKPDLVMEIHIDGEKQKEVAMNAGNLFQFDNKLVLEGDEVTSGKHTVSFRKRGNGPLYFNAYLTNFTLEDPITRAGLEVKVNRSVYKLTEVDKTIKVQGARGQALDQKVEKFERNLLESGATLKSGDLVEIELVIESKNDYEYLVFEDMKAAGFEPVDVRSGYNGNDMGAYVEFRDERVAFFVRRLARGKHSVSYRLRAEIPGAFSALPTRGFAMYAPELKANSDEIKLSIED